MKENTVTLNVAQDFSRFPAGRYLSDGPYSGQAFLEQKLLPMLKTSDCLKIVLDGAMGYGSSFLEEAFGGLVRQKTWTLSELLRKIEIVSKDEPGLPDEIRGYMRDAAND
ncbi:MAG: DUF4325 domain-containing protein [Neisseria sp.]|jgi:hypothetical protein|nr:MAG: DUF4325 domain-containing protein [Neisseria sp.]